MSNPIHQAVLEQVAARAPAHSDSALEYLDVGSGRGALIAAMRERFGVRAQAVDYHTELFPHADVPIHQLDLNTDRLPFDDGQFDVVTSVEVLEHVENYRAVVREFFRVLKPGGLLVVTTPNVLNMKSRLRFLGAGFFNLFGPLPVKNDQLYSTGGHITPIPYFYLAHALMDADYQNVEVGVDKRQRTSLAQHVLFWPLVRFGWWRFKKQEAKYQTINADNREHVEAQDSLDLLTGRTIVVSARKPG